MTVVPEGVEVVRDDAGEVVGIAGPGLTHCIYWPRTCAQVQAATPTYSPSCGYCLGELG